MELLLRAFLILAFFTSIIAIAATAIWLAVKISRRADKQYKRRLDVLYAPHKTEVSQSTEEDDENHEEGLFSVE